MSAPERSACAFRGLASRTDDAQVGLFKHDRDFIVSGNVPIVAKQFHGMRRAHRVATANQVACRTKPVAAPTDAFGMGRVCGIACFHVLASRCASHVPRTHVDAIWHEGAPTQVG